jgi:hypothetical protein
MSAVVQLDGSRQVNFRRAAAPAISAITVITNDDGSQKTAGNNPEAFAVFGTSEVSLKISGENFVPPGFELSSNKVFFGTREIPAANLNFIGNNTVFVKLVLNTPEILAELAARGSYGRFDITVSGQDPFGQYRSNAVPFYVVPPLPVLLSVTSSLNAPQALARYEVNSPGETLNITGFGFRGGAQLLFNGRTALNGIEIDTRFISSTNLQAYLPPQALRFGGAYTLRVRNQSVLPEVSGEAVEFQILNLAPQVSSIDTGGAVFGPGPSSVSIALTINGSNFHPAGGSLASSDPGTVVLIKRTTVEPPYLSECVGNQTLICGADRPAVVYVSPNQLIVPQYTVNSAGVFEFLVANVAPGGGFSNIRQFIIGGGDLGLAPTISGLSPSSVQSGSPGFNLTVTNDQSVPFQGNSWLNFGTVRLDPVAVGAYTLTVFVPAYLISSPGIVPVSVTNPGISGNTGGTSLRVLFSVN